MPRLGLLFRTFALLITLLFCTVAQAAPPPNSSAQRQGEGSVYFPQTGHNIIGKMKRFYDAHGGLDIFGLPLTEVFAENGLQVQYFERARFELHPELAPEFNVIPSRLGAQLAQGRQEPAFQWLAVPPGGDRSFFPESGHTLGGAFQYFWQTRGGLSVFGYPVSEEFHEVNPSDGKTYLVQYFERALFEYHPEFIGTPYEVQLAQLGRRLLDQNPLAQMFTKPAAPLSLLGKATTGFATSIAARRHNIARAAAMFDGVVVMPGQEYSFLSAGDFSEAAGFVEGYAIVEGRLEKVVGGGLCQVSTTMFRAVANAGLEITRRYGHSYVVYFYENILGFDATVFSPGVDFRWRNDTSGPVYLFTSTNPDAATVTFEIWGTSDGRTTSYAGPFIKNVVAPRGSVWQYDPTLPYGTYVQLVHGRSGMDVNYIRTVRMPNGSVKHYNDFYTHYKPWQNFFTYGPGYRPPRGATVVKPRTRAME